MLLLGEGDRAIARHPLRLPHWIIDTLLEGLIEAIRGPDQVHLSE
jgi:hypothetical protein